MRGELGATIIFSMPTLSTPTEEVDMLEPCDIIVRYPDGALIAWRNCTLLSIFLDSTEWSCPDREHPFLVLNADLRKVAQL